MVTTVSRKKIEVLVDTPLLRRIQQLANDAGVSGFTLQRTVGGSGEQGRWRAEEVTGGAGSKLLFTTIVDEAGADRFLTELEPLLSEYGLIVTVCVVEVIRGERF